MSHLAPPPSGSIRLAKSLLNRAVQNDNEALTAMFSQFLSEDETILFAEYLGSTGLWGFGHRSFACLTNRRIATMRTGMFSEVIYQDGLLEHTNSGIIFQPSRLSLYILLVLGTTMALVAGGLAGYELGSLVQFLVGEPGVLVWTGYLFGGIVGLAVSLPLFWIVAVRWFYMVTKCGLVWVIREGVSVYAFTDRKLLVRCNHLYRLSIQERDKRVFHIRETH